MEAVVCRLRRRRTRTQGNTETSTTLYTQAPLGPCEFTMRDRLDRPKIRIVVGPIVHRRSRPPCAPLRTLQIAMLPPDL